MSDQSGDWQAGLSALAARRDRVAGWKMFARYSLAPVHSSLPVVLLHGMNISSAFFRPALRRIGNHHRTYAPDLPGYGLSDKPKRTLGIEEQADVVARWFEAVGLSSGLVVGVSMGSQFAAALADQRPDLVRGLVLASPTMEPALRSRPRAMLRWAMELPAELRMTPVMLRDYLRAGVKRADDTLTLALEDEIESRLPRLHMPALVLHGENDHMVSGEWAGRVAELLPEGQLVTLPGAAHAMNYSSADAFARQVVDFAAELTSAWTPAHEEAAA